MVTAGAHLSTPPEPRAIRQATSPYVLTATVDTSSTAAGIAESDFYYMSADDLASAMDSLDALGVTQIRILVPWRNIEATEGEYDWSSLDTVIAAAAERGIAVTACVTSTPPTWASDYGYTVANGGAVRLHGLRVVRQRTGHPVWRQCQRRKPADLRVRGLERAQRISGWSPTRRHRTTPNFSKLPTPPSRPPTPDATVVGGGVVGSGVSLGTDTINAVDFIEQMYAAGAADYFDALSIHPTAWRANSAPAPARSIRPSSRSRQSAP